MLASCRTTKPSIGEFRITGGLPTVRGSKRSTGCPAVTRSPSFTRISATRPSARGAIFACRSGNPSMRPIIPIVRCNGATLGFDGLHPEILDRLVGQRDRAGRDGLRFTRSMDVAFVRERRERQRAREQSKESFVS